MSRKHTSLILSLGIAFLSILLAVGAVLVLNTTGIIHAAGIGDSGVQRNQVSTNNNGQQFNNGQQQTNNGQQGYHYNDGGYHARYTTIGDLHSISEVASTMFVVDGNGKTISVDANPYGIVIAPSSVGKMPGAVKPGDLVVTNFGGNQTGKTLVRIPNRQGPARLLNRMQDNGTNGPADLAFNTMTGSNWVANTSGNNIQVFDANGKVVATITNPLFHMPWGQAFNGGVHNSKDGAIASFFSTNAADGTIDRIDLIPVGDDGQVTFKVFQIGQLGHMGKQTFIAITWVPKLRVDDDTYSDVLLALDTVNNRVAAYPNSSTRYTENMKSTDQGKTVFKGNPLQGPVGLTISPTTGHLLVVNSQKNDIVELNLTTGKVVGDVQIDNVPVDPDTGNGSALFGVAATTDKDGNLEVYFTDDNTNTVNVMHHS